MAKGLLTAKGSILLLSVKDGGKGRKVPASLQIKKELLDNKRQDGAFLSNNSRAFTA